MFQKYIFSKKDFEKIEEGLKIINSKELKHIFTHKVEEIDILSFDSKFIYLWSKKNYKQKEKIKNSVEEFKIYKLKHNFSLSQSDYKTPYLSGGTIEGKVERKAPREINIIIPPFKIWDKLTRKSLIKYKEAFYSATIAHEFAHWYFLQNLPHSHKDFLDLFQKLIKKSKKQKIFLKKGLSNKELQFLLNPPNINFFGELYAFLVGLEVIKIFYPRFLKRALKEMTNYSIKRLGGEFSKIKKYLLSLDSYLYAHALAPYIFRFLPNWPKIFSKQ